MYLPLAAGTFLWGRPSTLLVRPSCVRNLHLSPSWHEKTQILWPQEPLLFSSGTSQVDLMEEYFSFNLQYFISFRNYKEGKAAREYQQRWIVWPWGVIGDPKVKSSTISILVFLKNIFLLIVICSSAKRLLKSEICNACTIIYFPL